jgi:hypothetical protein
MKEGKRNKGATSLHNDSLILQKGYCDGYGKTAD